MNSLGRDRRGKSRVDEMGGLDSIISLSGGKLLLETILLLSGEESLKGRYSLTFSFSERASLMTLATVDFPRPVAE